jgi:hypothetical protein
MSDGTSRADSEANSKPDDEAMYEADSDWLELMRGCQAFRTAMRAGCSRACLEGAAREGCVRWRVAMVGRPCVSAKGRCVVMSGLVWPEQQRRVARLTYA